MAPTVGPPEIHHGGVSSHSTGDPFIDLMSAHFNNPYQATTRPPMGLTENQSPTFLSTGDPCLDFFFHVLPDTPSETIHQLLKSAWDRDPHTAEEIEEEGGGAEQAKGAMERYNRDLNYQLLHDQILECFAQLLRSALASLRSGEMGRIGMAAKWCPSIDSSYDRRTLLCESIARRVFPRDSDPDYAGLGEAHYAYRIRDRLRKEVLVPLHAELDLPMSGIPMEVCIAMGILVSDLSEEPWKGQVISFSKEPQMHRIEGETLAQKVEFLRNMEWGYNTNFQNVFDQILALATQAKLAEEKMIKRVFVFSDMEFDQASCNPWETDYEAIKRKFRESGYSGQPEMVFWNLRTSSSTPVTKEEKGVGLVSGISKNQLKLFLDEGRALTPAEVMQAAITGDEHAGLVIFH